MTVISYNDQLKLLHKCFPSFHCLSLSFAGLEQTWPECWQNSWCKHTSCKTISVSGSSQTWFELKLKLGHAVFPHCAENLKTVEKVQLDKPGIKLWATNETYHKLELVPLTTSSDLTRLFLMIMCPKHTLGQMPFAVTSRPTSCRNYLLWSLVANIHWCKSPEKPHK